MILNIIFPSSKLQVTVSSIGFVETHFLKKQIFKGVYVM
jgi:hypothetical protein